MAEPSVFPYIPHKLPTRAERLCPTEFYPPAIKLLRWNLEFREGRRDKILIVCFMKNITIILFATFLLSGCATTLNQAELKELTAKHMTYTVSEWRYMGTKKGFHYFNCAGIVLWEGGTYKISENDLTLKTTFPYTKDSNKWILQPWGSPHPNNRKFIQDLTGDYIKGYVIRTNSNGLVTTNEDRPIFFNLNQFNIETNQGMGFAEKTPID